MVKKKNQGIIVIDTLIILCLIALISIGYYEFRKKNIENQNELQTETKEKDSLEKNVLPTNESNDATKQSPDSITKNPVKTITEKKIIEEPKTEVKNPGFYQNLTYYYSLHYPPEWPVKERSADNISVGVVPPKNGIGAITIEISEKASNELDQIKNEIKKYPFITIKEVPYTISDTTGTRLTLSNTAIKMTNVFIVIEKYGYFYTLKYTEESSAFTEQTVKALSTFKFTK